MVRRVLVVVVVVCACGRSALDPDAFDDGAAAEDGGASFEGVAVRSIEWANENVVLAPDDGVWLVFGSPPPSCRDPVISGGGVGWHVATYLPPGELGVGVWDYADGGNLDPAEHQGWFLAWHGNTQAGSRIHEGAFAVEALDEVRVRGQVSGIVPGHLHDDVPDPDAVDGSVLLRWCP